MKVILSRKGFDSTSGGYPSPIIDGLPLSLPIPEKNDKIKYSDLKYNDKSYFDIMVELGIKKYNKNSTCHLDPDLNIKTLENRPFKNEWRGSLGQINQSQKHLENNGVGIGDLFLFFGWFKEADGKNEKYPDGFHLIWAYMEIGRIFNTATQDIPKWLQNHPHFSRRDVRESKSNTIYVASEKLALRQNQAGYGILPFSEKLILTKEYSSKSCWDLNKLKELEGSTISYHNKTSWRDDYFQSAGRGQEFVIKGNENVNEKIKSWALKMIEII